MRESDQSGTGVPNDGTSKAVNPNETDEERAAREGRESAESAEREAQGGVGDGGVTGKHYKGDGGASER